MLAIKKVLVTGSNGGIGKVIVRELLETVVADIYGDNRLVQQSF